MRGTPVVLLLWLSLPGLALGQSMGEAVRKEAERREKNKKAGVKAKVYTQDDLASGTGQPSSRGTYNPPGAAGSGPPSESASNPASTFVGATIAAEPAEEVAQNESARRREDEARWRERLAQAKAKRDEAKAAYEELGELTLVEGEMYVDEEGRPVVRNLADLRERVVRAKAQYEAAEQALERLLEEARRAGVPPGWLR